VQSLEQKQVASSTAAAAAAAAATGAVVELQLHQVRVAEGAVAKPHLWSGLKPKPADRQTSVNKKRMPRSDKQMQKMMPQPKWKKVRPKRLLLLRQAQPTTHPP